MFRRSFAVRRTRHAAVHPIHPLKSSAVPIHGSAILIPQLNVRYIAFNVLPLSMAGAALLGFAALQIPVLHTTTRHSLCSSRWSFKTLRALWCQSIKFWFFQLPISLPNILFHSPIQSREPQLQLVLGRTASLEFPEKDQ